ncbi:hypothetical protein D8B26_004712 [Coccidioides posadasii str. Silveira]|uniref:Uncharacterized protein n=3 Tax=Coccidioides posadasii TaxID=199306 RepID=E9D6V3_COCPS|nr:hypothetical protein CPC735_062520 [Coccidioides posadasii C735 delta SOWgp]EER28379.1 hypothetical protein CPC735_062520 [Coccidioides posadasii C735 delta SOWgp]EFW17975.1 conserved hypothetical protein [Coccidioides posadasii str. Silveira]KMM68661.1 hypothetical protein CPAG_04986 [Coccidioides posadasii RMSCC 3488]QVM10051.1 hypothetical protein D8B26_004712 [Coccidioides posadasii str. Silveira]|eukprot:XP_003070524.1 hypothetical protein CPC735_062520 [Coccidioides posadasii C735 delta SOWgp]
MPITPQDKSFIGSETAAQELYGIGVRLGFYFQGIGLLLHIARSRKSAAGLKFASGSISLSLLVSWTVLAARQALSSCEAYIVLLLLSTMTLPGRIAFMTEDVSPGEGVGIFLVLFAETWVTTAYGWFFVRLSVTLPTLGTKNVTFFFAKVSLQGWFRTLGLVVFSLTCFTMLFFLYFSIRALRTTFASYRDGGRPLTEDEKKSAVPFVTTIASYAFAHGVDTSTLNPQEVEMIKTLIQRFHNSAIRSLVSIFSVLFFITTVELTIHWNDLSPISDLTSPGQLIPLVTGIVALWDDFLILVRPRSSDELTPGANGMIPVSSS